MLKKAGLTPVVVENGKEALDLALAEPFEIILLDMQMPVMDGYTAATRMREAGVTKPIVALTAHAMIGDEEKCRAAGCSDFLSKPLNIDRLLQLLADELGEDDREHGEDDRDDHERDRARRARVHAGALEQPRKAVGEVDRRVRRGEEADEREADLADGEEPARVVDQLLDAPRARPPFLHQLLDAAPADVQTVKL